MIKVYGLFVMHPWAPNCLCDLFKSKAEAQKYNQAHNNSMYLRPVYVWDSVKEKGYPELEWAIRSEILAREFIEKQAKGKIRECRQTIPRLERLLTRIQNKRARVKHSDY